VVCAPAVLRDARLHQHPEHTLHRVLVGALEAVAFRPREIEHGG
jgi:hypothetical protein